jgi:hypothetical protein
MDLLVYQYYYLLMKLFILLAPFFLILLYRIIASTAEFQIELHLLWNILFCLLSHSHAEQKCTIGEIFKNGRVLISYECVSECAFVF